MLYIIGRHVLVKSLESLREARRVDEVGVEVVLHVIGAHPAILWS